jgi:hypothetical protein
LDELDKSVLAPFNNRSQAASVAPPFNLDYWCKLPAVKIKENGRRELLFFLRREDLELKNKAQRRIKCQKAQKTTEFSAACMAVK